MASVFVREVNKFSQSGSEADRASSYTRTFLVRTDCVENISTVTGYVGVYYGTAHPEDGESYLESFETSVADDSGLLYTVTLNYKPKKPEDQGKGDEPDSTEPGNIAGLSKQSQWSASSSVSAGPCFEDEAGDIITNTAGDALEGLSREFADYKLTLTQYYLLHTDWDGIARSYTNTCNDAIWNGGQIRTWKCQGCSAKLMIENVKDEFDVETLTKFWELSWEFAYRKETWDLKVWDIGFSQRVDANKVPSQSGDHKAIIKGKDGKPVKTPVALHNGMAKVSTDPGWPKPDELSFQIYGDTTFVDVFGEIFT